MDPVSRPLKRFYAFSGVLILLTNDFLATTTDFTALEANGWSELLINNQMPVMQAIMDVLTAKELKYQELVRIKG